MLSPVKKLLTAQFIKIFFYFLFFILNFQCFAQAEEKIRIAIIQDAPSLFIKTYGAYKIQAPSTKNILSEGKNLKTTVIAYKDGILIGGKNYNFNRIFIKPASKSLITVNGQKFRGEIELIKKENNSLLVVNHIALDDYLKGVLYHEVSHYWPIEALKAQAVVSRTYALYHIQENRNKDYDLGADIYSQIYGGRFSERYRTNKAIESTRNEVLTYEGKIFPTYFHATCGGHTEDASLLWNINILPLKGTACSFCCGSPHFKWHYVLSQEELKDKLVKAGYKIEKIKEIVILGRDSSGRVINLEIISDNNKKIKISGKDFRNIIGPNILRSTKFSLNLVNQDVVFTGFGWGHGVGLCQWGAYFMAKKGYKYQQILKYYYPGSELSLRP